MAPSIVLLIGAERLAMLMAADRGARRVREAERASQPDGVRAVLEGGGVVAASLRSVSEERQ